MRLELTLACGDYEILRALKEGRVSPEVRGILEQEYDVRQMDYTFQQGLISTKPPMSTLFVA